MLDFIKDIFSSFRQTSLERVKSPVLGAFVFSWLGFNWQMVAIAMFSDKSMESRIEYINANFGIGSYLLGPICTTALLCFLLPRINKWVATFQDKPNTDAIKRALNSKIGIAKRQQKIADIEARKKLAEKREERHIEDEILLIKQKNINTNKENESLNNRLSTCTTLLTESSDKIDDLSGKLQILEIDKEKLILSSNNKTNEMKRMEAVIENFEKEISECRSQLSDITSKYNNRLDEINSLKEELFERTKSIDFLNKNNKELLHLFPKYLKTYKTLNKNTTGISWTNSLRNDYDAKYGTKPTGHNQ